MKHWTIAARAGLEDSLDAVRLSFLEGYATIRATISEYETALRHYKNYMDDVTNDQRDKAAGR